MEKKDKKFDDSLSTEDYSAILSGKKEAKEAGRKLEINTKEFTKMLTTTSRNHYTLNQMVDRKARILLSMNALILSLIIGRIIVNNDMIDLKFVLLAVSGLATLLSTIYAMMAMMPEKVNANLTTDKIKQKTENPLYYGNFINMSSDQYEETMIEMVENSDFVHRSLLKDIYQIGVLLEKKRKYLRTALYVLLIGILIAFILAFIFRIAYGHELALK